MQIKFDSITPAEMDITNTRATKLEKITAVVRLNKRTDGILARFEINFKAELTCVRCLETVIKDFREKYQLEFTPGDDPFAKTDTVELRAGDIDRVYFKGVYIDVSPGIREAIVLALPTAPLCCENCPGLCPVCGKSLKKTKCACAKGKTGRFSPS